MLMGGLTDRQAAQTDRRGDRDQADMLTGGLTDRQAAQTDGRGERDRQSHWHVG